MSETITPTVSAAEPPHHITFFRQSGWMMIANLGGGALMFAVHSIAQKMPPSEYGVFTTLLQIVSLMSIPAVGLQAIFAQQAAGAITTEQERNLAGVYRGVLRGTFAIWLMFAAGALIFQRSILSALKISNPEAVWVTLVIGLFSLWRPVMQGVLQGRQNFLWLGNLLMVDGVGRLVGVLVIVGLLANLAAGAMVGVLSGFIVAMAVGGWFSRDCLRGEAAKIVWQEWLKRVLPMTLGMGVAIFMLAADLIFVQTFFPKEQTAFYAAAGMIGGRSQVYFTTPIAAVMFSKLAYSKATGSKSNALALALGVTALAGVCAATVCTLFPTLPLRIVHYGPAYLQLSAPMIPLFAWCMLPLALATVLINSLMAQSQFKVVPWLLAVAAGYGATLYFVLQGHHDDFRLVIKILGIFGSLLLAVCAWFTWGAKNQRLEVGETI